MRKRDTMKNHRKNLMRRGLAAILSGMMLLATVLPAGPFTIVAKAAGEGATVTYDHGDNGKAYLYLKAYNVETGDEISIPSLDSGHRWLSDLGNTNGGRRDFLFENMSNDFLGSETERYVFQHATVSFGNLADAPSKGIWIDKTLEDPENRRVNLLDGEGNDMNEWTTLDAKRPREINVKLYYEVKSSAFSINEIRNGFGKSVADDVNELFDADGLVNDAKNNPYRTYYLDNYMKDTSDYTFLWGIINKDFSNKVSTFTLSDYNEDVNMNIIVKNILKLLQF